MSDGDASVAIPSLGYMCQKWSEPKSPHNPLGIRVFTHKQRHEAELSFSDPGWGVPSQESMWTYWEMLE